MVENGEAAVSALQANDFDLVLMDVNMPVMNGIEATKLHRFASIGQPYVPIVALTADATSDAWERCKEAGMDGYATKPIEPARLLEIIESVSARFGAVHARADEDRRVSDTVLVSESSSATETGSMVDLRALADLEHLGGHAFVSGLVSQFSNDAAELVSALLSAVADEDVKRFRDIAHALRGSAANLGATRVFQSCLALRSITQSQLAVEGEAQVNRLSSDIDETISMLKSHVAGQGSGPRLGLAVVSRH
jgi:two-component system, sensor histidine kinase RpfC